MGKHATSASKNTKSAPIAFRFEENLGTKLCVLAHLDPSDRRCIHSFFILSPLFKQLLHNI